MQEKRDQVFLAVVLAIGAIAVTVLLSLQMQPIVVVIITVLWILVMYLIFYTMPVTKRKLSTWKNTPDLRKITLSPTALSQNEIHLKLGFTDWRKPEILVNEYESFAMPNRGVIAYFTLNKALKRGETIELPFIRYYPRENYFEMPYNDILETRLIKFTFGEYSVQVVIVYGYSSFQEQLLKRFRAPISYDIETGITIGQIAHDD